MTPKQYFFCGIGGSGMLPLAMFVRAQGAKVAGSDRAFDQGVGGDKPMFLKSHGIDLFAQDGSGITSPEQILVTSTAVEATIPDVAKARAVGARHITRAELLSSLFNAAPNPVAVAGTSGKSTVTAMLGWILHAAGRAPSIINGAVMANFRKADSLFASFVHGAGPDLVAEVDESDGSIVHYNPAVAVLLNITIDHKPIPELKALFADYLARAGAVAANFDDPHVRELLAGVSGKPVRTWSISDPRADVHAVRGDDGIWSVSGLDGGPPTRLALQVFGDHNISNALAAIAAAELAGIGRAEAVDLLAGFRGVARRMEPVALPGFDATNPPVAVYDDFGHNPDKIAASLSALIARSDRVLALFQPHGYRPMEMMGQEIVAVCRSLLRPQDRLWMTDPVYYGGTVTKTPVVHEMLAAIGPQAAHVPVRADFPAIVAAEARPGDAIIIMGARDDTLTALASSVAEAVAHKLKAMA